MSAVYNVAIIGQTGVGKSALLNYIFGERVAKSGVGTPVTVKGFHPFECKIGGMDSVIYDSWGLEVGKEKEDEWVKDLNTELAKRTITASPSEWFHTVYYCIDGSRSRIQDFDVNVIDLILKENYKLTVVMTKADLISEEDELCLINSIKKRLGDLGDKINIIPVCSEGKKTRSGETKPFGKEEIEKQAFVDVLDSLAERVPEHCRSKVVPAIGPKIDDLLKKAEDKIGYFATHDQKKLSDFLNSELASIHRWAFNDFDNHFKNAFSNYGRILNAISKSNTSIGALMAARKFFDHKEANDLEWWEYPLVALAVPFLPIIVPLLARDEKQKAKATLMDFKEDLIKKMRELEVQRKNELISLGVKLKNEKSL